MLTRRRFLAASSAVAAAPYVFARAADEPKDKVRLAVIGVANRGRENLNAVAHEEIVALCDVDPDHAAPARKAHPGAAFFTDYRKLFDAVANKIDAVVVATPDHSHAFPTLLALNLGKHVYCEKPLARTVEEVRRMRGAATKAKAVTQMGTQIHAGDNYRRVVEIVKGGALGPISRVHVWLGRGPDVGKKVQPLVPVKFDTDLWLGPTAEPFFYAKHAEHNGAWPHWNWRYWWAFGGGSLADFGCHYMDLPFWALDLGSPTTIAAKGTPIPNADNTVPGTMQVDYHFPASNGRPAVHLTWYHGVAGPDFGGKVKHPGYGSGVLFEGEKAKLLADYSKHKLMPDEFAKDYKAPEPTIAKSIGHHREWLTAIRTHGKPLCEFGYAGNLAEAVLLGNVSYRCGQEIAWDAVAGKVTNTTAAEQYVRCETRKGWDLPG